MITILPVPPLTIKSITESVFSSETAAPNSAPVSTTTLDWQGFVGVGKQLALSDKLALQLLFLWDALSSAEIPLQDRVQLRVGILKRSAH